MPWANVPNVSFHLCEISVMSSMLHGEQLLEFQNLNSCNLLYREKAHSYREWSTAWLRIGCPAEIRQYVWSVPHILEECNRCNGIVRRRRSEVCIGDHIRFMLIRRSLLRLRPSVCEYCQCEHQIWRPWARWTRARYCLYSLSFGLMDIWFCLLFVCFLVLFIALLN
jgi:hypothetical protein